MTRAKVFRSASLRLAAIYAGAFLAAVLVLGLVTLLTLRTALNRQFDARIQSEAAALVQEYRTEGVTGVAQAVEERDRTPGALDYGLIGPGGRAVAGRLAAAPVGPGWSQLKLTLPHARRETVRILSTGLGGGYRLLVGGDDEGVDSVYAMLAQRMLAAIAAVAAIGAALGYALGSSMRRRVSAITNAAEAIIDGDLSRRVPVPGVGDDLDHLAATFNRMLDRIQALMESLRQVSNDIAHDLRTPLTRLRSRLESQLGAAGRAGAKAPLEAALADLDAILETFAALLRIAQIEGGARRAAFRRTDLAEVCRTVVEAFAPSAEDADISLRLDDHGPLVVDGDSELLTQMVVNLVENGLRHAGRGATVTVGATADGARVVLGVVDNGPGVPAAERERLFDRFYRLERSRSTPGSGLGLAMVAAVARLHGAEVSLQDASPGLAAVVAFPAV
ncbi:sensor histidine kinase [Caulobacter sp. KR2-114]|uniref:sensor histidine kinase n=1 Tax=Caulobacter sp. KR2-114 TaxID=3400912 RepID=UPI003C09A8B4